MEYDELLTTLSDYVCKETSFSDEAYATARVCLADSLGCAVLALTFPACTRLLGPVIPGTSVPNGARVPGTAYVLDPIRAAFNIGAMIRWLDFNDTWLGAEWGHPSDSLGGLLAVSDYQARKGQSLTVKDLLTALIQTHEIQGELSILNSFNRVGFDHVIFVKVATAAVTTRLLGGNRQQVADALSQAFVDAGPLRSYRHYPNTGSRKSWAAGDATSRGVQFAWMTMQGEPGYPQALSAKQWGLYDVLFKGQPFTLQRPLGSYVMENVLFKVAYPAEFHAQTAVEAAIRLHPLVKERFEDIQEILIETHESALRIIDKRGPLRNPADRDHCLQYMTAVGLLYGDLKAEHYEDQTAQDSRIDRLRDKMRVVEQLHYSRDYLDPDKRSIANALTIRFKDGTVLERLEIEYPLGHKRRRSEGVPLLYAKCRKNLETCFSPEQTDELLVLLQDAQQLDSLKVDTFIDLLTNGVLYANR